MFNRDHSDPSIDQVAARLRAASPEVSDLDLDRLKQRIQTQIGVRRTTRGANLRQRLVPVLVSLGVLGGAGFVAVEAVAAGINSGTQQYCAPTSQGGLCTTETTGAIVITDCVGAGTQGGTPGNQTFTELTVTGTTTDKINSITVTNTTTPPGGSAPATITTTGSSPYTFTATLAAPAGYDNKTNYALTAAQNLGGTAKATCHL
jgi:hypothetical protein